MGVKELTINYKNIPIYLSVYENRKEMPSIIFIHGIILHVGVYSNLLDNSWSDLLARKEERKIKRMIKIFNLQLFLFSI